MGSWACQLFAEHFFIRSNALHARSNLLISGFLDRNATAGDQTPHAVFIDGALARASDSGGDDDGDSFHAWYGAGDTAVGALRITVSGTGGV